VQVWEAIRNRRSIRKFTRDEIPQDMLKRIVEAGIWAPSGSNVQPWQCVLVTSGIDKIKMFSPGLFGDPSALIIICSERDRAARDEGQLSIDPVTSMDIGAAAQNMMLQAHELGIGSCPVRSFNQKAVQELLNLPGDKIPELIIALGYPDEKPVAPPRKKFEEVVSYERYVV
jgi:nitroreductase